MARDYNEEYLRLAEDYAIKQSEADRLDGIRKRTFSLLVNHFRAEGESNAGAEHQARASVNYEKAMNDYYDANQAANLAKAKYDAKKIAFEYWRTRQATKRAEMTLT